MTMTTNIKTLAGNIKVSRLWSRLGTRFLPFADAASTELPLSRILRLSLFQISVGMALVLLNGTLNRVMIVELGAPAWLVALMISLPVLFAPFRAVLGFKSDNHRSVLGWRRVPYIWLGTMLEFGGLAIMPFALILMSGDSTAPAWVGYAASALSFLLVGAGLHTTQTAGLALASDLAPPDKRHRVVALLYVILLLGMVVSSLAFGVLLASFSQLRLIQVIQGAAALTMVLNIVALWKQEARNPDLTTPAEAAPSFRAQWQQIAAGGRARRLLVAVALGTAAFSMQDILLEPYGGEILHQSVGETTFLTALLSLGTLCGFAFASRALDRQSDPVRLAAYGLLCGLPAFAAVIIAAPLQSVLLFRCGAVLIGLGGGLFTVCTLTIAMNDAAQNSRGEANGLALGAWGAVQATAGGLAIAVSGFIRDAVGAAAVSGKLGAALAVPATGYGFVYQVEIVLIFASLVAIGPLVRSAHPGTLAPTNTFGLAELPG